MHLSLVVIFIMHIAASILCSGINNNNQTNKTGKNKLRKINNVKLTILNF